MAAASQLHSARSVSLSTTESRPWLVVVAEVREKLAPSRLLTGVECDVLDGGALDQESDLLDALDVVVASVHSKLRMEVGPMTKRLLAAVRSPRVDVLGHCTGRLVTGRTRPQSSFDAEAVFEACAANATAVEINCRPERRDPPSALVDKAVSAGCLFAIDTDARAPGQLDWQAYGCERAEQAGIAAHRVITTWTADQLLTWTSTGASLAGRGSGDPR